MLKTVLLSSSVHHHVNVCAVPLSHYLLDLLMMVVIIPSALSQSAPNHIAHSHSHSHSHNGRIQIQLIGFIQSISFILFIGLLSCCLAATISASGAGSGPRFVLEPPNKLLFLNETGAIIPCKVRSAGTSNPSPLRIWWEHSDGSPVADMQGLRMVRPNGDLVLSPFSSSQYRQDVHSTVYRCMASNSIGTIRSRDCQVRAVIHQPYSVQVFGTNAITGNTGQLKCQIPAFVREYVKVIGWFKGDALIATAAHNITPKESRIIMLANGDLLLRNVTIQDTGYYRCQTQHELSKEIVVSSQKEGGHFIVNDVISGVAPRISTSETPVKAQLGQSAELLCITKAYPPATVRWFQASDSGLITPIRSNGAENIRVYDSVLYISQVSEQHHGNWICVANNSLGEERAYLELYVIMQPKVNIVPQFLLADMGSSATFVCNVTHVHVAHAQGAALSILWLKDGQAILSSSSGNINQAGDANRIRLIEPHVLNIRSVQREDAGCYQCLVFTAPPPHQQKEDADYYGEQATAELKLGDSPPWFVETFAEGMVFEQGATVSLICAAHSSSLLLPQIRWFLDGEPIDASANSASRRINMADYVKADGHLVSFLNITNAKVIDGGEYKCTASNSAGQVSYTARIKVIGPASLRPGKETTTVGVISGRTVWLTCPVKAYPIESLIWSHRSSTLPNNHRQQIEPIVAGVGGKLTIQNVHRENDQGLYECIVKGTQGKPVRASIQMLVSVAPLIDGQLISPQTIATQGMKVKLMCSVLEGDAPITIRWFNEKNPTQPISTSNPLGISIQQDEDYSLLTFKSVSINHMGNWTCQASNNVLAINRTTYLMVNVAPQWRIEPKNTQVVLGDAVRMDCHADGHPQPRIIWKKSTAQGSTREDFQLEPNQETTGTALDSQQPTEYQELMNTYRRQLFPNGTLFIQEVDKSDSGWYMCQVSNGIGAGLSKVIQLLVQSPPYFSTKFLSKSVSKGDTALLECECQGDPVLHVRWFKDRSHQPLIQTNTTASDVDNQHQRYAIKQDIISMQKIISFLQIFNVQREDSTIYTCVAKNDFGVDNTSVQLIVQEVPDPPQNIEVIEISSRNVQLQWKLPYSGNSPLIRFHVNYRLVNCTTYLPHSDAFWNEQSTQTGQELRINLKALKPSCFYEIKLSSENQIGRSEHTSQLITIRTMEEVPGGPPLDVQVEPTSSTSLKIRWRPPMPSIQNGRIRGYYIGYKVAHSDEPFQYKMVDAIQEDLGTMQQQSHHQQQINNGAGTIQSSSHLHQFQQISYITNLKRKTSYAIILQAYNGVGPGPRSDEIKVSTFDSQPPTTPMLEVVSTTYDAILLKWDSSASSSSSKQQSDLVPENKEEEYVLYYREDLKPTTSTSATEWHQKRIHASTTTSNQFVLSKENTQGRIRCGTKYLLYITATNSLGTGEPSETIMARTKGDTPIAPNRSEFIVANASTAILMLKAWQPRGCPIVAFTIQYKPVHQKQWIPLVEYFDNQQNNRDYFYVSHLNANRDYQLLVSAHSEPGVTRQEYHFHTPNGSAVVRLSSHSSSASAASDPTYRIDQANAAVQANAVYYRNITVLLPVLISLMVLIIILATLFACLRRQQHVNQVVNSVAALGATPHSDLMCAEHLRFSAKEAAATATTMLVAATRRDSQECYPMTEIRTSGMIHVGNGVPATAAAPATASQSSCDSSKHSSNLLLLNGGGGDPVVFGTISPRHQHAANALNHQIDKFATLQLMQQQEQHESSYYSSPQRRKLICNANSNLSTQHQRSDHEYAEPLQSQQLPLVSNIKDNHGELINNQAYSTIKKTKQQSVDSNNHSNTLPFPFSD